MKHSSIGPISIHLPETVETNDFLQSLYPRWDMDLIYTKTGIRSRRIALPDECSSDLGVAAAEKLFADHHIDRSSIDFLLFCTQTPDYPLPTTACLMQERLGLSTSTGALDFNLGCSGFVYGLSLADGLIKAGNASRVLLITAETYSKYIDKDDRSLRTIFGDGAAATIIDASETPSLGSFVFGTDGRGADALMLTCGGFRGKEKGLKPRRRPRWGSPLYMDGPSLVDITLNFIPDTVDQILAKAHLAKDQIDLFLAHQATRLMLDHLRVELGVEEERFPLVLENYGNTVSSTIPIVIQELRQSGRLRPGLKSMLIGFGVGFSWAGCMWEECWKSESP